MVIVSVSCGKTVCLKADYRPKINMEGYEELGELGKGAFGRVVKAKHIASNKVYALKFLSFHAAEAELKPMTGLPYHPNLVVYVDSFRTKATGWSSLFRKYGLSCIVMEYCNCGNLNDYVIKEKPITSVRLRFTRQIASAVQFLHQHGVVHRDLKPDNILITMHDSQANLKVGDFGVAKVVTDSEYAGELRSYYMGTAQGTQLFMAPDVFDGCYTEKADVFSMGLVYAAMWTGQSLQWKHKRFLGVIVIIQEEYLPIGKAMQENKLDKYVVGDGANKVPRNMKKLISKMTAKCHHDRPSAAQVATVLENKQCIIL